MKKKSVAVVLILGILIFSTGAAYSDWAPITNKFGPIVFQGPPGDGHPWGDSGHTNNNNNDTFPYYRAGSGSGYPDLMNAPTFTNFVLQFYLRYVVKQKTLSQSFIQKDNIRSK